MKMALEWTVAGVKEYLSSKFGSDPANQQLQLQDVLGHTVAEMSNDEATLGSYGASDFYTIHCVDANWVHGADFNLGDV